MSPQSDPNAQPNPTATPNAPPGAGAAPEKSQTVADLGRMVKQKYPAVARYQSMDDAQLGKLVRDKYPDAYGKFTDAPAQPKAAQLPLQPPSWKPQDLTGKDIAAAGVNALPMAGGAAGAILGGMAGHPIIGAGVGGAAGEAGKQAIISKVGPEKLSGPIFKVDAPPSDLKEGVRNALASGGEQMLYEAGGALAGKLLRGALGGPLHAETKQYSNALIKDVNERYGLNLTAQEVTQSAPMTQRIGEYSILSQSYIRRKWGQGAERGIKAIDDVLGKIYPASSPADADRSVRGVIKLSRDLFNEEAQDLYERQLKPVAGNVLINMRPVKRAAADTMAQIGPSTQAYGKLGGYGAKTEQILQSIIDSPDDAPFDAVHQLRTNLMKVSPAMDELMAEQAPGAAKRLVKETTDAMDVSLSASNPQVRDLWKRSRDFYREGAELFDHEAIQKLMSRDPAAVVESIKPHDDEGVIRLRDAILKYPRQFGDPADIQQANLTWRQFQEQFARSRLLKDPEHAGLAPDPEDLAKISENMKAMGPGVLREIYGGSAAGRDALANLESISGAFGRVQKLPAEGRKYVYDLIALVTSVGGSYAHSGPAMATAVGFEAVPLMVSGIMHSKAGTQYLLDGIGGLIKSANLKPAQALGNAAIKLQEHTITSDPSYRALGKAFADIARAKAIYDAGQEKFRLNAQKAGQKKAQADAPPGAGAADQDHIQLMLDEWR